MLQVTMQRNSKLFFCRKALQKRAQYGYCTAIPQEYIFIVGKKVMCHAIPTKLCAFCRTSTCCCWLLRSTARESRTSFHIQNFNKVELHEEQHYRKQTQEKIFSSVFLHQSIFVVVFKRKYCTRTMHTIQLKYGKYIQEERLILYWLHIWRTCKKGFSRFVFSWVANWPQPMLST